jgi:hypothetical protein
MQIASLLGEKVRSMAVTSILCIIAVVAGFITYDRVLRWITINHVLENRFIQYHLARYIKSGAISLKKDTVNRVHVIRPPWGISFLGLPFGIADEIYSTSARDDKIPGLIHFNLMQLGIGADKVYIMNEGIGPSALDKDKIKFNVTASTRFIDANELSPQVVINMNELLPQDIGLNYKDSRSGPDEFFSVDYEINGEKVKIIESSSGTGHYGYRAFDGSTNPDDFWETGGFPQWLEIVYPTPKEIKWYEFHAGYTSSDSMPMAWNLQGSDDGVHWDILDFRRDEVDWKTHEARLYTMAQACSYCYYRFYFTRGNRGDVIRIYEIRLGI